MVPDNLRKIHLEEERLRQEILEHVQSDDDLAKHLLLVERAMDLIHYSLAKPDPDDLDMTTLSLAGIRCFNGMAVSVKLVLGGYSQAAAAHLRDLLETVYLLDYFKSDRSRIQQWHRSDDKARRRDFSPSKIRKDLDKRDGSTSGHRRKVYDLYSTHASHLTPHAAGMLIPVSGDAKMHSGPFFDPESFEWVLGELALTSIQAALLHRGLIGTTNLAQFENAVIFQELQAEWFYRFHDEPIDHGAISALKDALAAEKQRHS